MTVTQTLLNEHKIIEEIKAHIYDSLPAHLGPELVAQPHMLERYHNFITSSTEWKLLLVDENPPNACNVWYFNCTDIVGGKLRRGAMVLTDVTDTVILGIDIRKYWTDEELRNRPSKIT